MTHVDVPMHSFLADFFATWPFNYLPVAVRKQIVPKLQLCSFQPGETIYPAKELPSAVHCVVQERVRIVGPVSHQSPTLAVVGKGATLGWDSLLRRVAIGSVRAAASQAGDREILTLALPADAFEALALNYLMPVLMQRAGLLELFDTLSRALVTLSSAQHGSYSDRAAQINLKEVVQYIDQEQLAVVKHWDGAAPLDLPSDHLWLVSSGELLNLPIGSSIRSVDQLKQTRLSPFPVRLLGIDRSCLTSTALSQSTPARLAPSVPPVDDDPTGPLPAPPIRDYPIWRASAPEPSEDVVACFGMICDRLQVPFRPDSLRRSLKQQTLHKFEPLDLYLRIAQAIGLNAQVVRFTPTAGGINRLTTPALIQCYDVFAVLHDVTPTTAVLGSPRTGLLQLDPAELATRLVADDPSRESAQCRAIVLERFPNTPTKRFGFNWFLPMVLKQRSVLVQVLLASIVIQLLGVANPLLVQQIIDNVIIGANAGSMTTFGSLMVTFALLEGVLTILRTYMLISTTNRIDLHLGVEIVRHMLHLPLSFFEKRPVGELSSRLLELENIRQFLTDTAITTVMDVAFSLFYIGVMFLYSVRLTLCVLLTIPVIIVSTLIMSRIQQKLIRVKADQGAQVQSYMVEVLGGISSVKSQHIESLVEATWRDRYVQYLTSGFTTSAINTIFYSYSNFLNTVSSLLVLWVGAEAVLKGELSLGALIAFRILTGYVTGPLLRLARLWQRFQETALSMELLADIADSPTEEELSSERSALQLPSIVGRVQFHDIQFGFKPGQLQLSNVDLDIARGTFVGIVGQSGSGKSTLMKLLPRLYMPQSGSITIDGYDVNKVDLTSLRSQIGIVSQDAVLFQGTIRDNIALFGSFSDEDVIAAAKIADAHDFIMQLPEGYSTQVGERGASLSGGQRQRVAIARVVMRNPRLLIFDEATSALDYETERRVCENLMQRFQGRTCFFITHRLNTIARADWILFMQSGIIAEQGTHQELLARRQLYYCLYAQQSREA
ncbi:peptidase domain-containing ABC transporter [Leptolyngbya sp. FACHB-36]|uniref:peptidase domain-containing ABC transporter n=1 Tax=Leptolyngbya sp. FACHB-36 TaxID=2692808 RepID=UPI001681745A|nr:peptidase domain-containing ABC transporter [Leptolyngbya sp. FACHB-36]MBD2020494.1 peptidase domain-containing ABC transporter [Leptolyngbya sp. FACHB-36]